MSWILCVHHANSSLSMSVAMGDLTRCAVSHQLSAFQHLPAGHVDFQLIVKGYLLIVGAKFSGLKA